MATLTVDRFLDAAACTAGEAFTMNGARLTIRTDTRVHANAPASMTGALGALTISSTLGGGVTIDGRNVRQLSFTGGTGNVPALGTMITQGGVSGYLLGVWNNSLSAPTAVGAAVPSTGTMKFREVTGGAFAAGALTGIGATAASPDVVGWIEVVLDQAVSITVPRLGDFTVRGAWYDLGVTTGVANQILLVPNNGSATAYTPGVWIGKIASPVTDEDWDFYPSQYAANFIAVNFGTDARSKFVCMETNGQLRIGHNGTVAVGFLPPAGRPIRIPNVFGRQCLAASRATSAIPSATATTRPDFVTTNAGVIDIENFTTDWWLSFAQPYSVRIHHCAAFDFIAVSEAASPLDIYDGGTGASASYDSRTLTLTSCFSGGTIQKWKGHRQQAGTGDHAFEVLTCIGQVFIDCESGVTTFARSTGVAYQVSQSYEIDFLNCRGFNGGMGFSSSFDCVVEDYDHCDRYVGTTNATSGIYIFTVASASNGVLIDGVTFGLGGTIANCHPYGGVLTASASKNVKLRNVGTRAAILNGGSANQIAYIYVSGGNNQGIKVQRCYVQPTRTGAILTLNSDKNVLYEHVYGDFADSLVIADLNSKVKNCGGTNTVTGQASVYGTHFWNAFVSDTAGRVIISMNEPTNETAPYVTLVAGTPKFTSAGNLVLDNVGDEVIWEMDYWCLGITAFANVIPVITGTNAAFTSGSRWGNHDLYYQIDKGSGFGGSWINFNQANLFAETGFNPAIGFKLKFRAVCAIASTTNLLTYVRFDTVSTLAAQSANLYPLDTALLQINGLVTGSKLKVTKVSNGDVLFNGSETAGAVSVNTDFIGPVFVEARKASADPYYQPWLTQITTIADSTVSVIALQQLDQ